MGDGSLLIVVLSTLAVSIATLLGLAVAARRLRSNRPAPERHPTPGRSSPAGPLLRGFGYLAAPLGASRRQLGVAHRLTRAFDRISLVDPYAASRRVGMAMMQGRPVDPPAWPPQAAQRPTLRDDAADRDRPAGRA